MKLEKPDIFKYYDPVLFLNDWIAYLKQNKKNFNLNAAAKKSGLSVSNISMILNHQRPLSEKSFQKIAPILFLSRDEQTYLNHLRIIDQSEDAEVRIESLRQIIKISKNKNAQNNEYRVFEYLTRWYKVAIFELLNTEGFRFDPIWVQKKLIKKVGLKEIEEALSFLKEQRFIGQNEDGRWVQLKHDLNCQNGIYKLSLAEFHRQIFSLAHYSIEAVAREERLIMGQTMALSKSDFEDLKKIIQDFVSKMNSVNKNSTVKDDVYHIEVAAFPLILNKHAEKVENEI